MSSIKVSVGAHRHTAPTSNKHSFLSKDDGGQLTQDYVFWSVTGVIGFARARLNTHTHLQTPVTLCREQSIRGYVSKERKVTRTDNSYFLSLLT